MRAAAAPSGEKTPDPARIVKVFHRRHSGVYVADDEIKQVIAVRTDLGMGRGKTAAQVGHACVMGSEQARRSHPEWFRLWWPCQPKIVVRVPDARELERVKRDAIGAGLPWSEVADAGRTQLEPGTVTCVSVGPAPAGLVDRITGGLRLL